MYKAAAVCFVRSFLLLLLISAAVYAAGEVDPGFNPYVSKTNSLDEAIYTSAVQPDGKVIIGGYFNVLGGHPYRGLARLNADGTIDTSFTPPVLGSFGSSVLSNEFYTGLVRVIALQPDGKILIGGVFREVNGLRQPTLIRLNSDGTPDTAFNTAFHQNFPSIENGDGLRVIKVLPNGQILFGGYIQFTTANNGGISQALSRVNTDGTFDPTFNTTAVKMNLYDAEVLPDGRILVAGGSGSGFNYTGLARLHSNGAIDFSFSGVHTKYTSDPFPGFGAPVYDIEVLPSGQILLGGAFAFIDSTAKGRFARVSADGVLDTSFSSASGANSTVYSIEVLTDGRILIAGNFTTFTGANRNKMIRLQANAAVDGTFVYSQANRGSVMTTHTFADGRIFIGGQGEGFALPAGDTDWDKLAFLDASGTRQPITGVIGTAGDVRSIVQQPDGKILIAGRFETINGVRRSNIARLNLDGTLDTSFVPVSMLEVYKLALQPDGKIVVASAVNAPTIRLNADGTKDLGFVSTVTGTPRDMALSPDGTIVVIGDLTVPGFGSSKIAKLRADGSLDPGFVIPAVQGGSQWAVLVQPDNKILVHGSNALIVGASQKRLVRLNPNGSLDASFLLQNPIDSQINSYSSMALQTDGKIILAGGLQGTVSATSGYVGRFNADGSLDRELCRVSDYITSIALQPDGKILLTGYMTIVDGAPRSGLARLNVNGTLDTTFQTGTGSNDPVSTIAVQADGKILAGGQFSKFNGQSRVGLARLRSATTLRTPFDFDGDGRADIAVHRPTEPYWYLLRSSDNQVIATRFAATGDIPVPADYDGDGKTDYAIFRPSSGDWWYLGSSTDTPSAFHWGQSGDVPLPSDIDGDGTANYVVYRPSTNAWFRSNGSALQFGSPGDKPLIVDMDGDGKSDTAVFRPSTGDWWWQSSSDGSYHGLHWGETGDLPSPADFDGDGKTDLAVYRPSVGNWYVLNSHDLSLTAEHFGISEDHPVPADYDGDGKADIAVYRPSTGVWFFLRSTSGFGVHQFGIPTDVPAPGSFISTAPVGP